MRGNLNTSKGNGGSLFHPSGALGSRALAKALAVAAGFLVGVSEEESRAETWFTNGAPAGVCIASSADGSRLTVGWWGSIVVSTNFGTNWTATGAPGEPWYGLASSADGMKLAATVYYGGHGVFLSQNGGVSWVEAPFPATNCASVAMSADGRRLVAASGGDWLFPGGPIYVSADSGTNWTVTDAPLQRWGSVACSADGRQLIAAGNNVIYRSSDFGATWNPTTSPSGYWISLGSSADGRTLAALNYYGICTSTNSGATWNSASTLNVTLGSVACSADGKKLAAIISGGGRGGGYFMAYVSTNSGVSWTETYFNNSTNHCAVACSADGSKLAAVSEGPIRYYCHSSPTPQLEIGRADISNLRLSWVVPSIPFIVEASSDLTTTNWASVTAARVINYTNVHEEMVVPQPAGNRYFRLVSAPGPKQ